MKQLTAFLLVCSTFLLISCANTNLTKGQQGAMGGAAGGALIGQAIGHNTEATLIGAAVGTLLGYIVGNEMDKYDRQQLNHVYERGVSGTPTSWVNPDNGNQYQVTPQPAYSTPGNPNCRQAEIIAVIDGKQERTYTTACRDSHGNWILQ
jgi:surface antigen